MKRRFDEVVEIDEFLGKIKKDNSRQSTIPEYGNVLKRKERKVVIHATTK